MLSMWFQCLPIRGHGFLLDKYTCLCRRGFYHPNRVAVNGFTGNSESRTGTGDEAGPGSSSSSSSSRACMPCMDGCAYCKDDTPCLARDDGALRLAVLAFQCMCMLLLFASMVLVYHFRRNKGIRASGLILLETVLCGALLLYFPVLILYFQPSVFRCILLRWVRLLGFSTVYGTLTLKLYRVLKVFLSRSAQRLPYMTSWRVLRLLGVIMLVVCWFLVAWTSAVCQDPDRRRALIDVGFTPDRLQFSMCLLDRWDYMMAVAEFLFLLWSVYLCFAVRTVPSAFHEPRYMAFAVHNELVLSAIFYIVRFTLAPELHPDWMLLLFFTHTHLTITVTLGLLLLPKFLFTVSHLRDDIASEAYEDEMDMGRSGSYLNSSITSAWSEHSLDPEDIREELKKLYSQLEIYKRKKMLANNPHLQKKRSSKKGLGRSLMRRITEIPESCSRDDKESAGEHGSTRNSICVLRKNPFDPSHQGKAQVKEETLKNKVFSLKKSHSSYDHVREPGSQDSNSSATDNMEVTAAEGSLLDTLMGKKLVRKKSSEKVDAAGESTESVPLVCKSASAHNLMAGQETPPPEDFHVAEVPQCHRQRQGEDAGLGGEEYGGTAIRGPSQRAKTPRPQWLNRRTNATRRLISSQSVEYKQTAAKGGIMKQASGSQPSICSDPVKSKELYDLSEVCPWEVEGPPDPRRRRPRLTTAPAPKGSNPRRQPQPPQKQQKAPDPSPSNPRNSKEIPKTSVERADVCPWEEGSGGQQAWTTGQEPSASNVSGRGLPPGTLRKLKSRTIWLTRRRRRNRGSPLHKQKRERWEKVGIWTPSKRRALPRPRQQDRTCVPGNRNGDASASANTERPARSPTAAIVATESPLVKKGAAAASSRKAETTDRAREKSKCTDDERIRTKAKDKSKSSLEKQVSQQKMAEVCPWEAEGQESQAVEKRKKRQRRRGSVRGDFDDTAGSERLERSFGEEDQPETQREGLSSPKKADVCPWDFDDSTATGKKA
ncbi:putative G-protein coupled receptor 158 [Merluccius polli]|uniref:G-protein coupled receptor 158 n=1 Tax=Merluccius polli TaxID=89951 RepID=A0AA47P7B7_MERPO|nr:putative G-protein coupled receptor 158 [Merluccius polli]